MRHEIDTLCDIDINFRITILFPSLIGRAPPTPIGMPRASLPPPPYACHWEGNEKKKEKDKLNNDSSLLITINDWMAEYFLVVFPCMHLIFIYV